MGGSAGAVPPRKRVKLSPQRVQCQADRRLRDSFPGPLSSSVPGIMARAQTPDPARFRRVMGAFPTGVTVVTARRGDGSPAGLTVNSLTSVSLEPLLVLVCIDHQSASHDAVMESGAFAVNLLRESDRDVSESFASGDREDRFQDLAWHREVTGSPVLDTALGWLDCTVHQTHVAGDHTIVVGRVEACDAGEGPPLAYHRGRYARVEES